MSQTNKADTFNQRVQEKRLSRIKDTKNVILTNSFTGLLNNQKWEKMFQVLETNNIEFEIKTLLSDKYKKCDFIREIEGTSLLIDDSGDFIEFLEIDRLKVSRVNELISLLDEMKISYEDRDNFIEFEGYSKG